jgi:hypothetical protein
MDYEYQRLTVAWYTYTAYRIYNCHTLHNDELGKLTKHIPSLLRSPHEPTAVAACTMNITTSSRKIATRKEREFGG